ncbi:MAG: hypothetical protein LBG60_05360 [Bifidobacteriaceae bacterium]|jgi:hypothetical protein|nr:hypothetical protein [Bifidobacteriaceae bacterium]
MVGVKKIAAIAVSAFALSAALLAGEAAVSPAPAAEAAGTKTTWTNWPGSVKKGATYYVGGTATTNGNPVSVLVIVEDRYGGSTYNSLTVQTSIIGKFYQPMKAVAPIGSHALAVTYSASPKAFKVTN